jgi:hypothetical protein
LQAISDIAILIVEVMLFSLPKKPVFTPSQLDRLANIFDNAGQGIFVVLVLTPLVEGIDKTNPWVLVLGVFYVVFCWTVSIILSRKKDET